MIWHIARRELLDNLMSLRFSLAIALVGALMIAASFLFIGAYGQRVSDYDNDRIQRRQEVEDASKQSWWGLIDLISYPSLRWVRMSPNPTDFLAGGGDRDVPNSFGVGAFRTEGPALKGRMNFMLPGFSEMDWSFIVGIVLSFVALIFTYDAVSGDKERGMLRLTLAQPVSRSDILLGKYVAAMFSVAIPFVFGVLLHLLVVTNSPLWEQGLDTYRRIMINEVRLARHITHVSPRATYQYACEAISGTGFPRFLDFYAQTKVYKGALLEFVRGEYAKREALRREHCPYSFDPSTFPEFIERMASPGEAIEAAIWDVFILVLFNVVFFMGAYVSFLRYDVR